MVRSRCLTKLSATKIKLEPLLFRISTLHKSKLWQTRWILARRINKTKNRYSSRREQVPTQTLSTRICYLALRKWISKFPSRRTRYKVIRLLYHLQSPRLVRFQEALILKGFPRQRIALRLLPRLHLSLHLEAKAQQQRQHRHHNNAHRHSQLLQLQL